MTQPVCCRCRKPVFGLGGEDVPAGVIAMHAECNRLAHGALFAATDREGRWLVVGVLRGTGERRTLRRYAVRKNAHCSAATFRLWMARRNSRYLSVVVEEAETH